jgi:hypothetical protein
VPDLGIAWPAWCAATACFVQWGRGFARMAGLGWRPIVVLRSTRERTVGFALAGRSSAMNCFECAARGEEAVAVAICPHCGIGICIDHLAAALDFRVGGTTYGCRHDLSAARRASRAGAHGPSSGHRHELTGTAP